MDSADLEDLALELFVETLRRRHGYDFSGYSRASLKRRVVKLAEDMRLPNIGALIPRVLYEPILLEKIVAQISVPASSLFRNPRVFDAVRREVLPVLASYPRINIWQAGCAYGEEVYSLAILLVEAELSDHFQIYATDFNDQALERADRGIFSAQQVAQYEDNYFAAGGRYQLSDYYHARYGLVRMRRELLKGVVFAYHNLVTDGVFAEAHLIMCRNVLIYFDKNLKNRVLELFADSLVRGGFLVLGNKETLEFTAVADRFETVSAEHRIYQLKLGPV